jgi:hypothetical protein
MVRGLVGHGVSQRCEPVVEFFEASAIMHGPKNEKDNERCENSLSMTFTGMSPPGPGRLKPSVWADCYKPGSDHP